MVDSVRLDLLVSIVNQVKTRDGSVRFLVGSNNVRAHLPVYSIGHASGIVRR